MYSTSLHSACCFLERKGRWAYRKHSLVKSTTWRAKEFPYAKHEPRLHFPPHNLVDRCGRFGAILVGLPSACQSLQITALWQGFSEMGLDDSFLVPGPGCFPRFYTNPLSFSLRHDVKNILPDWARPFILHPLFSPLNGLSFPSNFNSGTQDSHLQKSTPTTNVLISLFLPRNTVGIWGDCLQFSWKHKQNSGLWAGDCRLWWLDRGETSRIWSLSLF